MHAPVVNCSHYVI